MNVMEAIKTRRSIRKYDARPIEGEKLDAVMEAARLAPSAGNQQQWKFVLVRDAQKVQAFTEAANGQKFVGEAPAVIVVCATGSRVMACGQPTSTVDLSIAMTHILLAAHELGLGTCWLGNFSAEKVKALLGIPEDVAVVAVTPIGYPAETPEARPRKAAEEVISYDKY
ncbi:MAG: nitroreductase family protein [Peptococcaceae bacterium]|nr:nitroreductase family protein [Peptococcaceae bacterium]